MAKESYIERLQRKVSELTDYAKSAQELFHMEWYARTRGHNITSMKKVDAAKKVEREKFKTIESYLNE